MVDVPGSLGGNPVLSIDSQVFGVFETVGDRDWYEVTVNAGQYYFINLAGDAGNGNGVFDTLFEIYDSTGTLIGAGDDESGALSNSFLAWQPSAGGTYYISAQSYQDNSDGDYILSIFSDVPQTVATQAALTINSVVDTETTVVTGYLQSDTIVDEDWYAVTLVAGQKYRIDLAGTSEPMAGLALTNPKPKLYDATGTLIESADGRPYYTATTTGTYYVSASGTTQTDAGFYTLGITHVSVIPPAPSVTPLDAIDWVSWTVPHAPSTTTEIKVFFAKDGAAVMDRFYDPDSDTVSDGDLFTAVGWDQDQYNAALAVFGQYERVANVHFTVVTDIADANFVMTRSGTMNPLLGGYWDVGGNYQGAGASLSYNGTDYDVLGVGVFNVDADVEGYSPGDYGFHLLMHELGHGMGLAHPHDNGGGSSTMRGVTFTTDLGDHGLNQTINTVMSYNRGWNNNPNVPVGGYEASLMALDIAKLQEKYGAVASAIGNDTYTLHDGDTFYSAIWDTGGTDEIVYAGSASTVIDLRGADLQYSALGGGGISYVYGVVGGYTIANGVVVENATGGSGNDTLQGNGAANRLDGGAGADYMAGGDGSDTYFADRPDDIVYEADSDLASGGDDLVTYSGAADTSFTLGANIERLTLIGSAAAHGSGNELANTMIGNVAANRLEGGGGNDTFTGGGGDDTIMGGTGDDVAVFAHGWARYAIRAVGSAYSLADDSASGSDGTDIVSGVETFIFAGQSIGAAAALDFAPVIAGNTFVQLAVGGVVSGTGNLLANASDANASLGDMLTVSQARNETLGTGLVAVAVAAAVTVAGQYGTLSLNANGSYTYALDASDPDTLGLVAGQTVHDVFTYTVRDIKGLTASAQLNIVIGGPPNGAPVITSNGGGATATIAVGENELAVTTVTSTDPENTPRTYTLSGEDAGKFVLDAASGVLSFIVAPDFETPADVGADNVYNIIVTASDGVGSDAQAIAIAVTDVAGVRIKADSASNTIDQSHPFRGQRPGGEEDRIDGQGGNDRLKGHAGNDTLIGGAGLDTLTGGAGSDIFVFNAELGKLNVDRVTDFAHDFDLLRLDDAIFSKIGGALNKKEFYAAAGATKAHDASDRIVYDTKSGKLFYDDDGNKAGGHAAVQFAVLSSKPLLDHGDFVIV